MAHATTLLQDSVLCCPDGGVRENRDLSSRLVASIDTRGRFRCLLVSVATVQSVLYCALVRSFSLTHTYQYLQIGDEAKYAVRPRSNTHCCAFCGGALLAGSPQGPCA